MYSCYTRGCIIEIFIFHYIITTNISIIYEDVFLLYETMYNDNKYFIIHEDVFLLYEMMYNNNIYCHYIKINTSSCIIIIFIVIYSLLYNDNKYYYYTSSRITRIHLHV